MAIKKSQLYSSLWQGCDALRGGMDASQYKDYILVLLFVKYVSDKYSGQSDTLIKIPKGGSFQDMIDLKGTKEIGKGINDVIDNLVKTNPELKGVIDVADFNDPDKLGTGQEMQDKLTKLVGIFQNEALDFSKNRAEGDDLLGDAYEYLMRNFATQSGKSKGQFYTPTEVSRIIAKVIGIKNAKKKDQTVYDPTCGSGSLLLRAANETSIGITIYGQENDVSTRALAVMNMWLHDYPYAEIWRGNTLSSPHFTTSSSELKTFDYAVANPPFSLKSWNSGFDPSNDVFGRFDDGIPPNKNGDYAFLLHVISSLNAKGKGAIILPHGVLFRGNVESEIRKKIIERRFIKGVIGLPPNLFYGTGIPACIIVLDKENADERDGIFMIDASKEFTKDGDKNRLRERDIHKIVDVFINQIEIPKYSRMVPISEISDKKNDYNLNIPRYIDSQEEEDLQDIEAHLKGGIPNKDIDNLESYWKVYSGIKKLLFSTGGRKNYSVLNVDKSEIKSKIFEHDEFKSYSKKVEKKFLDWKTKHLPLLNKIDVGSKPKDIIFTISESLLQEFSGLELIDKYDVYQQLMQYWEDTMQDDVYLLAQYGWKVEINVLKNSKGKATGWENDLIPKQIAIDTYFIKEKEHLESLKSNLDDVTQKIQTLDEENEGEEDIFSEVRSDSGSIVRGNIEKRIKKIENNSEFSDEFKMLTDYRDLLVDETDLKKQIKDEETKLDEELLSKYKSFTNSELKTLVIENKWIRSIHNSIKDEMEGISHNLAERIRMLAKRYELPLPSIMKDVDDLTKKTDKHLQNIGYKW